MSALYALVLCSAFLGQDGAPPGPLDAFRANRAAIRAEVEFLFVTGELDTSAIVSGRIWDGREVGFTPRPESALEGTWTCDGEVERGFSGSPDEVIAAGRKGLAGQEGGYLTLGYTPKTEWLLDGVTLAYHSIDEPTDPDGSQAVLVRSGDGTVPRGMGPFFWWDYPFPQILSVRFPGVVPRTTQVRRSNVLADVETYFKEMPKGCLRLEIAYEPDLGYLPRHTRMISSERDGKTFVRESYLVGAQLCATGGYVPTEWYVASFQFEDFEKAFPAYDETTVLVPTTKRVFGGHFRVTAFRDLRGPVAMTHLRGIRWLVGPGGMVPLRTTSQLTLTDIKSALGRKLAEPPPMPLPTIDATELQEFNQTGRRWWVCLAVASAVVLGGATWRWCRHRRVGNVLGIVLVTCAASGCGHVGPSIIKLSAGFEKPTFLHDARSGSLSMTLLVRNDGNVTLRLLGADGGCSCRAVDQDVFPRDLRPGGRFQVKVTYDPGKSSQPQAANITFQSDHGPITVAAPFYALLRHQIDPEAPTHLAIDEGGDWQFELTHRAIFETEGDEPDIELVLTPGLAARKIATREGRVGGAPGYSYRDETYVVTLLDRSMGLHKGMVQAVDPGGDPLVESTVVWRRVAYLSPVPERVALAERPVRVFLRCPDEQVELTRVLASPAGVRTMVSSPRELTIVPDDLVVGAIDGVVEVETTAEGRPPLRVPVVRYARSQAETVIPATAAGSQ